MSMTGSLMGYENNNEVNQAKCKKPLKPLPVVSSINASGVTTVSKSRKSKAPQRRGSRLRGHVNSLWSVWYGIIAVSLQTYIASRCVKRFFAYISLPWPVDAHPPRFELYACLMLAGAGVFLLPVLLAAAIVKKGNLANDGIKLGRNLSTCSRDPSSSLLGDNAENGLAYNLWRHGGPTAAFVHLCTAMCFLLPTLLMEARLIHVGFLPKDAIWRTDLDWVVIHRDRLVVLGFMNPPGNLSFITPRSYVTSTFYQDNNTDTDFETIASMDSNNSDVTYDSLDTATANDQRRSEKLSSESKLTTTLLQPASDSSNSYLSTLTSATLTSTSGNSASTSTGIPGAPTDNVQPSNRITPEITARYEEITSSTAGNSGRPLTSTRSGRVNHKNGPTKSKTRSKNATRFTTTTYRPPGEPNMTAHTASLTFNSISDLDNPKNLNIEMRNNESYGPITLEYMNYAMALGVYSVRYPAVFWSCNKALGTIFSLQLVVNSAQSLLAYAGMSVLYKVQVVGPLKALPLLRHRNIATTSKISSFFGDSYFLLNPHVTLALFALSSLLVLCSSMVMYMYAYGRFTAFINREKERRVILSKGSQSGGNWGYFTHCAALCVFLAIAICNAPLLYDYTVVYRGSLDGAILACIIGTVLHLFLWLVLWVFLTIKQRWTFKLRVSIGRATVRSARSVKLVTEVDLLSNAKDDEECTNAPLLVVGNGRTYTISDASPKKAIMSVIQKASMDKRARSQAGGNVDSVDGESSADVDEQIYWLRPKLRPSPAQSPTDGNATSMSDKGWLNKKLKPKVTFNDLPSTSGSRNKGKTRRGVADGGPDDDGDYATLRELPLMTAIDPADDSTSEENKLLECVNDDQVTYYASGNRDLQPSEGDPSPLLTPDPLPDPASEPLPLPPPTPTLVPAVNDVITAPLITNVQLNGPGLTPRCLRRTDSGMPHEELTPRSDSSNSPPLDSNDTGRINGGSSNGSTSETSSGVHSNASNASNDLNSNRRATSAEELPKVPQTVQEVQWRSSSLQRGIQPPTSANYSFSPAQNYSAQFASQAQQRLINGSNDALILDNAKEATVVIRRRLSRPKLTEPMNPNEEPFGRSTNMRMTSFTENNDLRAIQPSSATLPHYPTQPIVTYPHCSTMPLPHASHNSVVGNVPNGPGTGSCGSVPRHMAQVQIQSNGTTTTNIAPSTAAHTTLPSHHNGVRLMHAPANPFVKRFPPVQVHAQPWPLSGHHTFPQPPSLSSTTTSTNKLLITAQVRQSDRDSANFSMASSGDSDTCLPH